MVRVELKDEYRESKIKLYPDFDVTSFITPSNDDIVKLTSTNNKSAEKMFEIFLS